MEKNSIIAEARFVGIRAVEQFSGYSKATIKRRIRAGEFPPPAFKDNPSTVRWDYADLVKWREEKLRGSDQAK